MSKKWIGLIGQNGSGKSTVCRYLGTLGFNIVSLSDVVRIYADDIGENKDRDTLTRLSNELKNQHGLDYFAKKTSDRMIDQSIDRAVFDSVRHPLEMDYLMSYQTQFIGVSADQRIRYERIQSRGNSTDFVSFDTFKAQDDYELNGKSTGQFIQECLNKCAVIVDNNDNELKLISKIDDIIKRMRYL